MPPLAVDVVPESILTVLLGEGYGTAAACFRFAKPGLVLTEPGAAFAEAGLTLTGLVLMGGLEQMEGWGTDFSSVALADFNSGFSAAGGDECSLTDTGRGSKVLASSHLPFKFSEIPGCVLGGRFSLSVLTGSVVFLLFKIV